MVRSLRIGSDSGGCGSRHRQRADKAQIDTAVSAKRINGVYAPQRYIADVRLSMKTCFKCNIAKPITEFYRHSTTSDGHLGKCKTCTKLDNKEARARNINHYWQYDRARASMPHRKEIVTRLLARWRNQHPERHQAQLELHRAVRLGEVIPQPCFVCGKKAEAHHPNYDAPLDVVWLCKPHHEQAHALVR